jgi:PAS domain S-box-containing protein
MIAKETPIILVVDDERVTRMLLRHLLEQEKYRVIEVENGEECLTAYQQEQPDMVLLDAMMPVMDGFTCCQELQKLPNSDRIPILMITALDDPVSVDRAFAAGAIDYVTKPIHPPVLRRRLRRILEASWAEYALKESEQKYRSLVNNLKEVIFQTDIGGNFLFLNPAWTEISGFSVAESLGNNFAEFIHPEDLFLYQKSINFLLEAKITECRYQIRYLRKDGGFGWIEVYASLIVGHHQISVGLSGTFNDISDRKRREKHLKADSITTHILAESATIKEAIPKILTGICDSLEWDLGQLWMFDYHDNMFRCLETCHGSDKGNIFKHLIQDIKPEKLSLGEGIPSLIWQQKEPIWLTDLTTEINCFVISWATQLGFNSAFGVSILDNELKLGVMIFWSREIQQPDSELLQTMQTIGSEIGQFIRRKQVEEELQLLGKLLALRYQSYLVIDQNLIILKTSPGVEQFSDDPETVIIGQDIRHGFPEFVGFEENLLNILAGKEASFEINGISRNSQGEIPRYINIYVVANQSEESLKNRLFIFFEEISEQMALKQKLLQKENEAFLLLEQLSETNEALKHQNMMLHNELQQAAQYVQSLLPLPLNDKVVINQQFVPSLQLGGDAFDYYWLDSDRLVIYLVDVAGHGVKSALLSVSVLNLLRSKSLYKANFYEPKSVLTELNRVFQMSETGDDYFTIWYGVYNHQAKTITYSCAGHPPAILLASQYGEITVKKLESMSIPIGMLPDFDFEEDTCEVENGSVLYLFSDGIYEIKQPNGKVWGLECFTKYLIDYYTKQQENLASFLESIQNLHNKSSLDDDCSLLEIRLY